MLRKTKEKVCCQPCTYVPRRQGAVETVETLKNKNMSKMQTSKTERTEVEINDGSTIPFGLTVPRQQEKQMSPQTEDTSLSPVRQAAEPPKLNPWKTTKVKVSQQLDDEGFPPLQRGPVKEDKPVGHRTTGTKRRSHRSSADVCFGLILPRPEAPVKTRKEKRQTKGKIVFIPSTTEDTLSPVVQSGTQTERETPDSDTVQSSEVCLSAVSLSTNEDIETSQLSLVSVHEDKTLPCNHPEPADIEDAEALKVPRSEVRPSLMEVENHGVLGVCPEFLDNKRVEDQVEVMGLSHLDTETNQIETIQGSEACTSLVSLRTETILSQTSIRPYSQSLVDEKAENHSVPLTKTCPFSQSQEKEEQVDLGVQGLKMSPAPESMDGEDPGDQTDHGFNVLPSQQSVDAETSLDHMVKGSGPCPPLMSHRGADQISLYPETCPHPESVGSEDTKNQDLLSLSSDSVMLSETFLSTVFSEEVNETPPTSHFTQTRCAWTNDDQCHVRGHTETVDLFSLRQHLRTHDTGTDGACPAAQLSHQNKLERRAHLKANLKIKELKYPVFTNQTSKTERTEMEINDGSTIPFGLTVPRQQEKQMSPQTEDTSLSPVRQSAEPPKLNPWKTTKVKVSQQLDDEGFPPLQRGPVKEDKPVGHRTTGTKRRSHRSSADVCFGLILPRPEAPVKTRKEKRQTKGKIVFIPSTTEDTLSPVVQSGTQTERETPKSDTVQSSEVFFIVL